MDTKKQYPKRKRVRLKEYDYSSSGAYYLTICTANRRCTLSRIPDDVFYHSHEECKSDNGFNPAVSVTTARRGLAPAVADSVELTTFGEIARAQLFKLKERFPDIFLDAFVIMPNHIHAIIILADKAAGASPRPTVCDVVCAYKSLTTLECRSCGLIGKLFQPSFYEHIIRSAEEYKKIKKYILENPMRWFCDELFSIEQ